MATTDNQSPFLKRAHQRRSRRYVIMLLIISAIIFLGLMGAKKVFQRIERVHWYHDPNSNHYGHNNHYNHNYDAILERYARQMQVLHNENMRQIQQVEKSALSLHQSLSNRVSSIETKMSGLEKKQSDVQLLLENFDRSNNQLRRLYESHLEQWSQQLESIKHESRNTFSKLQAEMTNIKKQISVLESTKSSTGGDRQKVDSQIIKDIVDLKTKVTKNNNAINQISEKQLVQETIIENMAKEVFETRRQSQKEKQDVEKVIVHLDELFSDVEIDVDILRTSVRKLEETDKRHGNALAAVMGQVDKIVDRTVAIEATQKKAEAEKLKKEAAQEKVEETTRSKAEDTTQQKVDESTEDDTERKSDETISEKWREWAEEVFDKTKDKVKNAKDFAQHKAGDASEKAKEWAGETFEKAKDKVNDAKDFAQDKTKKAKEFVQDKAQKAARGLGKAVDELEKVTKKVNEEVKGFVKKMFSEW